MSCSLSGGNSSSARLPITTTTTMIRCCALSLLLAAFAAADTKVAVLEIGSRAVVRRTTGSSTQATVAGIQSLWSSLHDEKGSRRSLASRGMSVVSDLFNKPDAGIAVSLVGSGVDLAAMPAVSSMLGNGEAVGVMNLAGLQGSALIQKVGGSTVDNSKEIASTLKEKVTSALSTGSLQAVVIRVDEASAAEADAQLSRMLASLKQEAASKGTSIVLHLVVEEEGSAVRRRLEDNQNNNNNQEGGNDDGSSQAKYSNGFYGYGYYNDNGEWVVVSKTIFQIQYFQVVFWTAIGLVFVLCFSFHLMTVMPLMADTLLFGESSKMIGD